MENAETAADALRSAGRLQAHAREAGRWYVRYLTAYAVASFALVLGFGLCVGLLGPKWASWVIMPPWVLFVIAIVVYANRQRARLPGLTRNHTLMMLGWGVVWGLIVLGSVTLHPSMGWWLTGGLALATPPLVARHYVQKRFKA